MVNSVEYCRLSSGILQVLMKFQNKAIILVQASVGVYGGKFLRPCI